MSSASPAEKGGLAWAITAIFHLSRAFVSPEECLELLVPMLQPVTIESESQEMELRHWEDSKLPYDFPLQQG